jgi:hypothetical protein
VHPWKIKELQILHNHRKLRGCPVHPITCVYLQLNKSMNVVVEDKMLVGEFRTSKKVSKRV